jgi:hypothetical protein
MNKNIIKNIRERILIYKKKISSDNIERNRFLVLFITLLFLFDYLVFCYHTEKNPFNIFPSIPILEDKKLINVYLPYLDGQSILKESRRVSVIDNDQGFVRLLFKIVVKGSYYENTAAVVPVDIVIRGVWIYEGSCIIDLALAAVVDNVEVIPGSESTFRRALEKTITENIPTIERVIILERGIPGKNIWEIARSN